MCALQGVRPVHSCSVLIIMSLMCQFDILKSAKCNIYLVVVVYMVLVYEVLAAVGLVDVVLVCALRFLSLERVALCVVHG